jgi:hypothetical protein
MFAVIWLDIVLDELADIVVTADLATQDRMTKAVERMNRRLASRPHEEGESRGSTDRITFPEHLAVWFSIDETQRVVRVQGVKRYGG